MKTKFTKGEWNIQDDGYGMIGVILKKGLGILIGRKSKETQANAHLIAAAPDMYEMLDKIHNSMAGNGEYGEFYCDVKDLLAKARGEHE